MAPDKHAVRAVTFLGRSVHTVLNEQGAVPSALVALGAHRSRRRDPPLGLRRWCTACACHWSQNLCPTPRARLLALSNTVLVTAVA